MIRVLVCDDHPLLRCGIRSVLALEPDFSVPGEAADAEETIQQVGKSSWDIVLLDISLPGRSGLEVVTEIRRLRPQLPVLILSVYSEGQFAVRAMRAGAQGYLTKNDASGELVPAIRRVLAGRKYVSTSLGEALADADASGQEGPLHEVLSDREFQVMCEVASGKTVSQIADEMGLSVKTVSTYRGRALAKMKMRTNADFTRYALENRLIT